LPISFGYPERTTEIAVITSFGLLWLFSNIVSFSGPWYLQHRWRNLRFWKYTFKHFSSKEAILCFTLMRW